MRTVQLLGCAGVALALAGCDSNAEMRVKHVSNDGQGGRYAAVERLDCPEQEGDLRLESAAADGRSCLYRTRRGGEVELRVTPLNGQAPEQVLAAVERELEPLVPGAPQHAAPAAPEPPQPTALPAEDGGRVRVPGLLDIQSKGDNATIRMPGVSIVANGDKADVRVSDADGQQVTVNAEGEGARVRARSTEDASVRSSFILASETPGPQGWRVAGYQARGPAAGPLVVGVAKVKDEKDDAMDDMQDLVRQNVRR